MEDAYCNLLNGESSVRNEESDELALTEGEYHDISELNGALSYILDYSEIDSEEAGQFDGYISDFIRLKDKFSTDDDVRILRRSIAKLYYKIYKKVFLKDYKSKEETPLIIDLFLYLHFEFVLLIIRQFSVFPVKLNKITILTCKRFNLNIVPRRSLNSSAKFPSEPSK
jgi:hypothetical protein